MNSIYLEGYSDDVLLVELFKDGVSIFKDELYELPFKFRIGKFEIKYSFDDKIGWNVSYYIFDEEVEHTPFEVTHGVLKPSGYAPIVKIETEGEIKTNLMSVEKQVLDIAKYLDCNGPELYAELKAKKLLKDD